MTPLWLLASAFVLSGAAGLIYETVWTRYISLFVGHSAYAQVLVLVIFLGGMALGATLTARRSAAIRRPLLAYAIVELVVGVLGAVFHPTFVAVTGAAYRDWFPALGPGTLQTALQWFTASALILPQSVLLGATFPLLTAGALRHRRAASPGGDTIALLYFANSLGAAGGVLLEGFVLLDAVGLAGTLRVAAVLNGVVALMVGGLALSRGEPAAPSAADAAPAVRHDVSAPVPILLRALLAVSFTTALSSFFYEIGWIRMLSLVLGSATHAFELMLSAFIFGLALGALVIRRQVGHAPPLRLLGQVQWAMGLLAVCSLPVYLLSFRMMAGAMGHLPPTGGGYAGYTALRYGLSLAVMLPTTVCAGMTLPLITRTLLDAGVGERAVGFVYGINTAGSIVGVALAALVLLPLVGLKAVLAAGAAIDIAVGVALLAWDRRVRPSTRGRGLALPLLATGILFAAVVTTSELDRSVLSGGVYRHGRLPPPGYFEFLHYRDGRTATVSLRRVAGDTNAMLTLATNGKPDASLAALWRRPPDTTARIALNEDAATQLLMPIIAMAHAPRARRAAVIGHGSGMTSHALLGHPALELVETIEIEPEMIRASRGFYPANRRVFDDPRSRLVIADARASMSASGALYDVIVSEPSNPWVSGVAGLFTEEFYARMRDRLAPGGVLGQWLHLYDIDDELVLSVIAAIDRVFADYDVYMTTDSDIFIVATMAPSLPHPDWGVLASPGTRDDLRRVHPITGDHMATMRAAGRSVLRPLVTHARARANSDFAPVLDLGAERARYEHRGARGLPELSAARFDVVAAVDGRRRGFVAPFHAPTRGLVRMHAFALGAAVRAAAGGDPGIPSDSVTRQAVAAYRGFLSRLGTAPADWRAWCAEFVAVEGLIHGGTAGVADESLYGPVRAALDRHRAPESARAAVRFMHGLASWDFPAVAAGGEILLARARAREFWVPPEYLRDGLVVAAVRRGDRPGAVAAATALEPFVATTLRGRMVSALAAQGGTR